LGFICVVLIKTSRQRWMVLF